MFVSRAAGHKPLIKPQKKQTPSPWLVLRELWAILTPLKCSSVVSHIAMVQPNYASDKVLAVCVSLVAHSIIEGYDSLFINQGVLAMHIHTSKTTEYCTELLSY